MPAENLRPPPKRCCGAVKRCRSPSYKRRTYLASTPRRDEFAPAQAHELAPHAAQTLLVEMRKTDYATDQQEQNRELGIHKAAFLSSPRRGGGCCNAKSIPKLKN